LKRIKFIHVIPVIVNVLLSILFTSFLVTSNILEDIETPFLREVTLSATIYNSILFFLLIVFGSILLFIIIKIRKISILKLLFISSFLISLYGIIEIYGIAIMTLLDIPIDYYIDIFQILFIIASFITTFVVFKMKENLLTTIITLVYGSAAGCLFGVIIPLWSIILISLLASLYDIYSVFYGPLKYLINLEPSNGIEVEGRDTLLKGVTVPFLGIHIGLGDIIFYSMIVSGTYIYTNIIRAFIIGMGICVGAFITFKLLEKRRALPALPIPIFLSLILLIGMLYI